MRVTLFLNHPSVVFSIFTGLYTLDVKLFNVYCRYILLSNRIHRTLHGLQNTDPEILLQICASSFLVQQYDFRYTLLTPALNSVFSCRVFEERHINALISCPLTALTQVIVWYSSQIRISRTAFLTPCIKFIIAVSGIYINI